MHIRAIFAAGTLYGKLRGGYCSNRRQSWQRHSRSASHGILSALPISNNHRHPSIALRPTRYVDEHQSSKSKSSFVSVIVIAFHVAIAALLLRKGRALQEFVFSFWLRQSRLPSCTAQHWPLWSVPKRIPILPPNSLNDGLEDVASHIAIDESRMSNIRNCTEVALRSKPPRLGLYTE